MERRELGRTGLQVSVLGFGGSEIGFERAEPGTVRTLLQEALDAGLNVIDTAECYGDSEALVGPGGRRSPIRVLPLHQVRPLRRYRARRLERCLAREEHRSQPRPACAPTTSTCSSCTPAPRTICAAGEVIEVVERARQRGQTRFIGYSGDGPAARYAVECGRFDTLQTSINVADQEALHLTLPLARLAASA